MKSVHHLHSAQMEDAKGSAISGVGRSIAGVTLVFIRICDYTAQSLHLSFS